MDKNKKILTLPGNVCQVSEMVESDIKIPFANGVDIKKLVEEDKNPLFVVVEALSPQISQNNREWEEKHLFSIAEQINSKKPDGYSGHLREEDRSTKTPLSQTLWLGAIVKAIEGKKRLFVKGYILPYAEHLRKYLKTAKAASKKVGVSIYGTAKEVWDSTKNAYRVSDFNLESIDWARPGAEGVTGTGYLKLTSEMKNMDKLEIIKGLTLEEIKGQRKDLVDKVVSEMSSKIKEEGKKEIDNLKKKIEEKDKVVSEIKDEVANLIDLKIDQELSKSVENSAVKSIVKRLVIAEMKDSTIGEVERATKSVLESEEGKSLISEMNNLKKKIVPQNDNRQKEKSHKFIKF
jgi:hypothetical protein